MDFLNFELTRIRGTKNEDRLEKKQLCNYFYFKLLVKLKLSMIFWISWPTTFEDWKRLETFHFKRSSTSWNDMDRDHNNP